MGNVVWEKYIYKGIEDSFILYNFNWGWNLDDVGRIHYSWNVCSGSIQFSYVFFINLFLKVNPKGCSKGYYRSDISSR